MKAVIVAADILSPYGRGVEACWQGLLAGRTAVGRLTRFATQAFQSDQAAIIPHLSYRGEASLVMQMLSHLLAGKGEALPNDARLLLATTKGEIDLLEKTLIEGKPAAAESALPRLLKKVVALAGTRGEGLVLSAACTSSAAALARAAALVHHRQTDCVLVVAGDGVTEFVYAGFSSLMALDKVPARPFDRNRGGLSVGEAAGFAIVMSEERARREGRPLLAEICGWGLSDDANHMTGPSRTSEGLVMALGKALQAAGIEARQVGFIAAHGTGTSYNDSMEMRAFQTVFGARRRPVYSVKGGLGHTMGAAGLVETLIAQRALQEGCVPPTVNLKEADADAVGWVADVPQAVAPGTWAVVTNAGFGGVNTALVLGRVE